MSNHFSPQILKNKMGIELCVVSIVVSITISVAAIQAIVVVAIVVVG